MIKSFYLGEDNLGWAWRGEYKENFIAVNKLSESRVVEHREAVTDRDIQACNSDFFVRSQFKPQECIHDTDAKAILPIPPLPQYFTNSNHKSDEATEALSGPLCLWLWASPGGQLKVHICTALCCGSKDENWVCLTILFERNLPPA